MAQDLSDLRESDLPGLVTALAEAKDELFKLRFRNATGQLENTAALGAARKRIARINTFLRQREIAAAEAAQTTKPTVARSK
jgi:large subunit ribosomal protein L29